MNGIELREVWFKYPGSKEWALRGVSLEIRRGEVLALVGPNGSGKTTILKLAGGLYRPSRGEVTFWGSNIWEVNGSKRLELRRAVVYVHEKPILLRGTALDNVTFAPLLRGVPREEAIKIAEELLSDTSSAYLSRKDRREMSAGEAQVVSILRAVAAGPKILLLDEPTAHLDREKRVILTNLIGKLRSEGMGIAIATHDHLLALRTADRVVIVENGVVGSVGRPSEILDCC
ncbi:MAG: ABC transporter ATP-binding protein [Candidatus Korarchaeota archaeon]|nr:ABC transporter ATP-binding protein [Candidatus Korarchaeota archaeon]